MPEPWYRDFFRGDYQAAWRDVLQRFDPEAQASFIAEKLALRADELVLDAVCGHGRHAIPLARQGFRVRGFDLSELEIRRARDARREAKVDARFAVGDMRAPPLADGVFDAAYNVFTSFGFFDDPADDLATLRAIRRALRVGGRFFIDTVNPFSIARRFSPRDWERTSDGLLVLQEHEWDFLAGVMRTRVTLEGPERRMHTFVVRMYTPDALRSALEAAGFRVREAFGGWDGRALGLEGTRLMLLADAL